MLEPKQFLHALWVMAWAVVVLIVGLAIFVPPSREGAIQLLVTAIIAAFALLAIDRWL